MDDTFKPVSVHAVRVLARLAARRKVEAELRDEGVKPTFVRHALINERARTYLDQHPELLQVAEERARLLGLFERKAKRPKPKVTWLAK